MKPLWGRMSLNGLFTNWAERAEIPKRPFLTLTEEDKEDLLDDIQDYFQRLIK